jgi:hypothetical protein
VLVQSAPGRFDIAGVDPTVAHAVAAAAEDVWRVLTVPLALPDAFSSPIFVRVMPAAEMASGPPFHVTIEAGGIVSARLRAEAASPAMTRRMLVQSLVMRIAVARHGVGPRLTVPLWLEHACAGWWETRTTAAQLDALKQMSARERAPSLAALLGWQQGNDESPALARAAIWLLAFLQSESGQAREWPTLLLTLLKGHDPLNALASSFPGRFSSAEERELWWQTGYHHVRRIRTLPALEAGDSREQLALLARFVFAGPTEEVDIVVPLATVLAHANEPVVEAEITRRAIGVSKLMSSLHPFYRNAGLSLNEAFAARSARPAARAAASAVFEQDWRDAVELEQVARTALDALEKNANQAP